MGCGLFCWVCTDDTVPIAIGSTDLHRFIFSYYGIPITIGNETHGNGNLKVVVVFALTIQIQIKPKLYTQGRKSK